MYVLVFVMSDFHSFQMYRQHFIVIWDKFRFSVTYLTDPHITGHDFHHSVSCAAMRTEFMRVVATRYGQLAKAVSR